MSRVPNLRHWVAGLWLAMGAFSGSLWASEEIAETVLRDFAKKPTEDAAALEPLKSLPVEDLLAAMRKGAGFEFWIEEKDRQRRLLHGAVRSSKFAEHHVVCAVTAGNTIHRLSIVPAQIVIHEQDTLDWSKWRTRFVSTRSAEACAYWRGSGSASEWRFTDDEKSRVEKTVLFGPERVKRVASLDELQAELPKLYADLGERKNVHVDEQDYRSSIATPSAKAMQARAREFDPNRVGLTLDGEHKGFAAKFREVLTAAVTGKSPGDLIDPKASLNWSASAGKLAAVALWHTVEAGAVVSDLPAGRVIKVYFRQRERGYKQQWLPWRSHLVAIFRLDGPGKWQLSEIVSHRNKLLVELDSHAPGH